MRPRRLDPNATRMAVLAVQAWLRDESVPEPDRAVIGQAVRLTARTLAAAAPGACVEVRIPPFVAVQCVQGPRHTRGTPANVVETDPLTWLQLATGLVPIADVERDGRLRMSGARAAEIASYLPLVTLDR